MTKVLTLTLSHCNHCSIFLSRSSLPEFTHTFLVAMLTFLPFVSFFDSKIFYNVMLMNSAINCYKKNTLVNTRNTQIKLNQIIIYIAHSVHISAVNNIFQLILTGNHVIFQSTSIVFYYYFFYFFFVISLLWFFLLLFVIQWNLTNEKKLNLI